MSNAEDMSTPVTRGELREELARLRQEFPQAIAPLATKADLDLWGGALLDRIQSGERAMKEQMKELLKATERQLQMDLARYAGALQESMSAMLTAHDEKYADLPGRVRRLEGHVFGPESR